MRMLFQWIRKNPKPTKQTTGQLVIISNFSKLYENLMYKQLYLHFETVLSSNQCGLRKGYSAQHRRSVMIGKLKEAVDNGNEFDALLADPSKAFGSIDHSLVLAKRSGYRVSHTSLKLIFSYFEGRTQRTKIANCFSNPSKVDYSVPKGPILGSLFFNISLIDMFSECEDTENYADVLTPNTCAPDTDKAISKCSPHVIISLTI